MTVRIKKSFLLMAALELSWLNATSELSSVILIFVAMPSVMPRPARRSTKSKLNSMLQFPKSSLGLAKSTPTLSEKNSREVGDPAVFELFFDELAVAHDLSERRTQLVL